MKEKDLFIEAISTLFFSWGSEAPDEVFWGMNDMLNWYEKEYNVSLNIRFERDDNTFEDNFNDVINAIKNN